MTDARPDEGVVLGPEFFARDTVTVARDVLGKLLVREVGGVRLWGRLVEVEAYLGPDDLAAHSVGGRRTPRTEAMYGPPGRAYVYLTYGMHHCLNVTAERPGAAGAVLLRALEPLAGIDIMRAQGDHGPEPRLLSGPGKIGRAFRLTLEDNGRDFTRGSLGISAGTLIPDGQVAISRRIGISRAMDFPYRFAVVGSRSVSRS